MSLPRLLRSAVTPVFADDDLVRVVKSLSADLSVSPAAVLVYPGQDQQGDVVEPDGGDWRPFERNGCLVNFEHGPHIGFGEVTLQTIPVPVRRDDGTVADELTPVPVGVTTFFQKAADLRGQTLPRRDTRGNVIGTYTADECLRTAEQVAPLVANGVLNGVSVEFRPSGPKGQAYDEIGHSPLLDRPACHFKEWFGLGWAAACHMPVNDNARYLPYTPRLDEPLALRAEKAFKVCEDPGTLDFIRKSLSPLAQLARHPRRVTVAMNTQHKGLFGGSGKPRKKKGVLGKVGGALLAGAAVAGGVALARSQRGRAFTAAVGQKVRAAGQGVADAVAHHLPTMHANPAGSGSFGQHNPKRPGGALYAGKAFDPDHPETEQPVDDTAEHDALPEGMTHTPAACFQGAQSILDVAQMLEELMSHSERRDVADEVQKEIDELKAMAERVKATGDKLHAELSGTPAPADDADKEPLKTDESGAIESKSFGDWRPARLTAADLGPVVNRKSRAPAEQGLSLAEQKELIAELRRLRQQAR